MSEDQVARLEKAEQRTRERLRRIEGQVRGIHRMVEERRPCTEIVTQVLAARAALDRVLEEIVTTRVDECLATLPAERARASIAEAVRLLSRAG